MKNFPTYRQPDSKDCGPTCLKIISKHYKKIIDLEDIRNLSETTRQGTSMYNLSRTADLIGFKSLPVMISLKKLNTAPLPCILFWNSNHFVVLYKIKNNNYYISDPSIGLVKYSSIEFIKGWIAQAGVDKEKDSIALLLEPTASFFNDKFEGKSKHKNLWSFIMPYLVRYKSFIAQLTIGLFASSLINLILPFLIQSVVDVGIRNQDFHFIYLILAAQIVLFSGRTAIEILNGWILLHLSTRINISLISDFFIKLMNLPMSYFDTRITGDILQRISDHKRIERLMTISSLSILFSVFNLLVFGIVLIYYNLLIFGIFLLGTIIYVMWIVLFLKQRRIIDHKNFLLESEEHTKHIELINGMQEIKLNNSERKKRWDWEQLQIKIFQLSLKTLKLEQFQSVGSSFINELKNLIIIMLAASLVISGDITLGMMLAISYIIGQLNHPISQIMNFIKETQDANIALERIAEIHDNESEETSTQDIIKTIPDNSEISLKNVSFRYLGTKKWIIDNLSLEIPSKKVTAIVGSSGSGKTTLIKLILKFYLPNKGKITVSKHDLKKISQMEWRSVCSAVLQDGYIFYDSIANNIAMTEHKFDKAKLLQAIELSNCKEFVDELPLSYNTKIGNSGVGLSAGQKQRLLIARAIYSDPKYLFLDEATSALDASNERSIIDNLRPIFNNKTVVIIAHRLSTVKNADQIIVLNNGKITEKGTHHSLLQLKGYYYNLVKNQLELDN